MSAKRKTETRREPDSLPPIVAELGDRTPGYREWFAAHPGVDENRILQMALKKEGYAHADR